MSDITWGREIHSLFDYNPETGVMLWRDRPRRMFATDRGCSVWNARYAGKIVGSVAASGYRLTSINDRSVYVHRIAWELSHSEAPEVIDHVNGVRSDNRICNLRNVSVAENPKNTGRQTHRGSGFMGVRVARSGKFCAHVRAGGRQVHLGTFDTVEQAVAARANALSALGYHPNHGLRSSGEAR